MPLSILWWSNFTGKSTKDFSILTVSNKCKGTFCIARKANLSSSWKVIHSNITKEAGHFEVSFWFSVLEEVDAMIMQSATLRRTSVSIVSHIINERLSNPSVDRSTIPLTEKKGSRCSTRPLSPSGWLQSRTWWKGPGDSNPHSGTKRSREALTFERSNLTKNKVYKINQLQRLGECWLMIYCSTINPEGDHSNTNKHKVTMISLEMAITLTSDLRDHLC